MSTAAPSAAPPSKPSEGTPLVAKPAESEENSAQQKTLTLISVGVLIAIAVIKTQLTALLFTGSSYPTAYSFYSCIVTCVMLIPAFIIVPSQWGVPIKEMFTGPTYALTLIVIFTSFDLGFTNIALSELSTALQQCIAATNPFWTIIIESVLHKNCQHPIIYLSVSGVVFGAILTTVAGIDKVSVLGLCSALLAVICSASKYVFTHQAFRAFKGKLGPLALLFWVDILMLPIYIPWVLINGELVALLKSGMDAWTWAQFTGTAALGGVRALTQYIVLLFITATSMSTANIFTQILNILVSLTWQHDKVSVTPTLILGVFVTMGFSFFYSHLKSNKNACFGIMQKKQDDMKQPLAQP